MEGSAEAPAAGTVLNALATGTGAAFAIDRYVTATVDLREGNGAVNGTVAGDPEADTRLIEQSVDLAAGRVGADVAGTVHTDSEVPPASGLKSSSAAANAAVLATLDALDAVDGVDRADAARLGVRAAREVGVTVTGAFDDAAASMLGGLAVTNNDTDALLVRDEPDWDVLVFVPPERAFSADADAGRCERIAPVADLAGELALAGRYAEAMTVNGLAFCAALGFSADPAVAALPDARGVSLSGTGPSYVAVGDRSALETVRDRWSDYEGETWLTTTQAAGAGTT